MYNRRRVPYLPYVKGNSDVLHIFCNVIVPQNVAVFLFQRQIFINRLWKLNYKLSYCLHIFLCTALPDFSNDLISLPQHVLHPPVERRPVINLLHHRVLRHLRQAALFKVIQTVSGCALVFPENTNIPSSS